jgi:hypothetical protein
LPQNYINKARQRDGSGVAKTLGEPAYTAVHHLNATLLFVSVRNLYLFKCWAAVDADSPALFATPLAPHRRIYPSFYIWIKLYAFTLKNYLNILPFLC